MVSVFNAAEFIHFMAGIMAQRGSAYLDRLKKIKEDRVATEKVVGGSTVETHAPFPDQAPPPPPDSEKGKRKSKDEKKGKEKKESSSQPSLKRSRPSVPSSSKDLAETDKGLVESLFGSKLNFAKGTSVALSSAEKKALTGCSTVDLVNTCLKMHSRSLAMTKVIRAHVLKGGVAELARMKEELSASSQSLKESREANSALGEALRTVEMNLKKVEQERDALRAYSEGVKKSNERLSTDARELEQSLSKATLTHDEAVSEKAQLEIELNDLKDYVLDLHKEAFSQAFRQAVFLYRVPEQNNMDPDKDVFNGCLVPIKDIPTVAEDPTPKEIRCRDDGGRKKKRMVLLGRNDFRLENFSLYIIFCIVVVGNFLNVRLQPLTPVYPLINHDNEVL